MDRNLQAFLAVARTRNLTEASSALAVTQPSVSKRIANLESEYGAQLFDRSNRTLQLTPAGQVLLERAKIIEAEYQHSIEMVCAIGAAGLSELRVGAGPLFHMQVVAPLFRALTDQFPHLTIDLLTDANVRTIPMLIDGRLDVVLGMIEPEHLDSSVHYRSVVEVEHGIVFPRDHAAAEMKHVDPTFFKDVRWVIYTDDPHHEKAISEFYLPENTDTLNVSVRTTSFITGLELVSQGNFVMSAPLQLASIIRAHGLEIRPVVGGMRRREAGVHVRKSSLNFAAIKFLLSLIEDLAPKTTSLPQ